MLGFTYRVGVLSTFIFLIFSWITCLWHEVKELFINGADVEAKDNNGATLLSWASANESPEVAGLVIEKGANVDSKSKGSQ